VYETFKTVDSLTGVDDLLTGVAGLLTGAVVLIDGVAGSSKEVADS
jgi:hypothetical protein